MAVNLNLLPQELSGNTPLGKLDAGLKKATYILVPLFLVFAAGLLAFYLVVSYQVTNGNSTLEALKAQIKEKETTEQKLVLVRDRLSKVKSSKGSPAATERITLLSSLFSIVPQDSVVGELSIDSSQTELSLTFKSTSSLAAFFNSLTTLEDYENIQMTSFGFSPSNGYLISLKLI